VRRDRPVQQPGTHRDEYRHRRAGRLGQQTVVPSPPKEHPSTSTGAPPHPSVCAAIGGWAGDRGRCEGEPGAPRRAGRQGRTPDACAFGHVSAQRRRLDKMSAWPHAVSAIGSTPRGSPTARVPARRAAQPITMLAASCWAWRTRRRCRASASRCARRCWRHPPGSGLAGSGRAAGGGAAAGLGVGVVLVVLGADRPPGHQQPFTRGPDDRVGVDDAQIDPGHPARVGFLPGRAGSDRHLGGHVGPQPARVEQQRDRADLGRRVGQVPVQAYLQRRAAAGHRDVQHPAVEAECAVIPAHRHHPPPAAREPGGQGPGRGRRPLSARAARRSGRRAGQPGRSGRRRRAC
jgi:hypothetical protein